MKERIRELANQAGEYVNEVYTPPVRSKTPGKIWEDGHIAWHEQFNQKFAELIVRECCDCLNTRAQQIGDVTTTVGTVGKIIKEHFGVAE